MLGVRKKLVMLLETLELESALTKGNQLLPQGWGHAFSVSRPMFLF